ncbi:MAG: hydrogenase maturation nickel metallochaperone HypA [Brooklawnia sp.]|jgi:hydrogenase nickel incorporation protein HypA/HybF
MHELGLLRGVVAAVSDAADKADARGVRTVALRVGTAAGVVREALEGSWPMACSGSRVAGAQLQVDWVPATVWCQDCQADQPIDEFFALACPVCDAITPAMPKGREFEIAWVDLEV